MTMTMVTKAVRHLAIGMCAVGLAWGIASCANVVTRNSTDTLADWNMFTAAIPTDKGYANRRLVNATVYTAKDNNVIFKLPDNSLIAVAVDGPETYINGALCLVSFNEDSEIISIIR